MKKKIQAIDEKKVRPMALTVKAVIVRDKDQVLLLRRAKGTVNPEKLDLPGGHLDEGETLEECMLREIQEETGLNVAIGSLIRAIEFPKDHKFFKQEKRGLRYLAFYQGGEVQLNEQEHTEYLWLKIDDAIAMLENDGFELEKKETLITAKENLAMMHAMDGWKRALADMDNYRKRIEKSNDDFRKYCLEDFVLELLPVVDNFDLALEHIPMDKKNGNWVTGIMHIRNQLEHVLKEKGVDVIPTKLGDEIDANIHEVIKGDGKIKKVLKRGYKIGDKIIRAAVVEAE